MLRTVRTDPIFTPPLTKDQNQVDRLTGIVTYHHQHPGADVFTMDIRFSDALETTEQPYHRRMTIGPVWIPVDLGWIETPSVLIVKNNAGHYERNPSAEQKEEDAAKIVELRFEGSKPWLIRPGRPFVGEPSETAGLHLRCQHGTVEVTVVAIPR
jgi:hypothetical protein